VIAALEYQVSDMILGMSIISVLHFFYKKNKRTYYIDKEEVRLGIIVRLLWFLGSAGMQFVWFL
jgi:chromosome segregation ATPase